MTRDPYKYFRIEAREIVAELSRGALDLEKQPLPTQDVLARLLRGAHTLKGAARVVKQREIADDAHAIEDVLEPYRAGANVIPRELIDRLLALSDAISRRVDELPAPAPLDEATSPPSGGARAAERDRVQPAVRADVADVDELLEGIAEAHQRVASLRGDLETIERMQRIAEAIAAQVGLRRSSRAEGIAPRTRALAEELHQLALGVTRRMVPTVDQADREIRQVRARAERLRLLPASGLFGDLERATRDAAQAMGKRVAFEAAGHDVRLDAQVLVALQSALVQLVRNAVAHGIETPDHRVAAGKPPTGRVTLSVQRRGPRVTFACSDDGRGVDLAAVRRVAEQRGRRFDDASDTRDALFAALLAGGISTSRKVTEMSGRGVGLDVVRESAARVGASVAIRSDSGLGTTVEITVPVSLAALPALLVQAVGHTAAIPLDAVRRTVSVAPAEIAGSPGVESIVFDGNVIPLRPLARTLRIAAPVEHTKSRRSAVVVESRGALAAVSVDRLVGTTNVVMRPLPRLAIADDTIAGASLDADGKPQLVLNVEALVASAHAQTPLREVAPATPTPPILVIDDSLTTRMLEQSVLESAGYEVELATSAEEGLEKAKAREHALFLVDVEMPGMDGFTFVELTRADPVLRQVPAILVTSRGEPEDRERGRIAGAAGYVVKSELDQTELLEMIARLVNAS